MSGDLTAASFGKVTCFDSPEPVVSLAAQIGAELSALPSSIRDMGYSAGAILPVLGAQGCRHPDRDRHLGVTARDTIAAGDGLNDIEMPDFAGTAVAIEGSDPRVLCRSPIRWFLAELTELAQRGRLLQLRELQAAGGALLQEFVRERAEFIQFTLQQDPNSVITEGIAVNHLDAARDFADVFAWRAHAAERATTLFTLDSVFPGGAYPESSVSAAAASAVQLFRSNGPDDVENGLAVITRSVDGVHALDRFIPMEGENQPLDVAFDSQRELIHVANLGGGPYHPGITTFRARTLTQLAFLRVPGPVLSCYVHLATGAVVSGGPSPLVHVVDGANQRYVTSHKVLTNVRSVAVHQASGVIFAGDRVTGEIARLAPVPVQQTSWR